MGPGSTRRLAIVASVAAALTAATPAQARYRKLSDERTHTVWSHVRVASVVRAKPSHQARRVGRVETRTFVGDPEVVLVLGRSPGWSRVRYPRLGNQTGWVPTRVLSSTHVSRALIVIDRHDARLTAYKNGKRVLSVRVGVGASESPTPLGRFYIRERVVPADPGGPYGVLAFGMSAIRPSAPTGSAAAKSRFTAPTSPN